MAIGCGSSSQSRLPAEARNPDVVAVFGNEFLTLHDFEQRYERTTGSIDAARDDSLSQYQDFLERYVDFRLKVRAAEEAGIDELPSVQNEIRTYRANLARPYLIEQEIVEPLVKTLYERRQTMNDVSHILLRLDPYAEPAETLAVYQKLSAIRDSILQGADFGEMALRHSEDPSARRNPDAPGYKGRLGFFSAGRIVEPFESYSYELPIDSLSPIFRTRFGYHFLKVNDRIDAVPNIRLSHILLREGDDPDRRRRLADSLRQEILNGADFEDIARQYSEDIQSRMRGGDIGMVSYDAPLHSSFKEPAFALKNPGDISEVLETPYGFHIVKLTDRAVPKSLEEEYDELKELVTRLPRYDMAQQRFAGRMIRERGGWVDTTLVVNAFEGVAPDSVITTLVGKKLPADLLEDTVMTFAGNIYTFADLADGTERVAIAGSATTEGRIRTILTDFVTNTVINYEADRLEERDPEFRRLMAEFRDGLVLFQFMEDSVWTAAENDSLALLAFYEEHRDTYRWPDRERIIGFRSRSDSLLNVISGRIQAGEAIAAVYEEYAGDSLITVRMDTTMIADSTKSVYDQAIGLAAGSVVGPIRHRSQHILLVNDGIEPARPKTFSEARAQVVNEYQQVVEARLIQRLRDRYNVQTFPQRLVNAYRSDDVRTELTSGG